ncbi:hypothetical protein N0V88_001445 [Collariella sp. IMI 366227]|nr:hypothetical protein N0V88_001445 [Collariella sp. IMI 366227]
MSGCVNCVWDRYRDEMEEWVDAEKRAAASLRVQQVEEEEEEELYKNVPVGIREFMKQEKRLKEKHLREGTMRG